MDVCLEVFNVSESATSDKLENILTKAKMVVVKMITKIQKIITELEYAIERIVTKIDEKRVVEVVKKAMADDKLWTSIGQNEIHVKVFNDNMNVKNLVEKSGECYRIFDILNEALVGIKDNTNYTGKQLIPKINDWMHNMGFPDNVENSDIIDSGSWSASYINNKRVNNSGSGFNIDLTEMLHGKSIKISEAVKLTQFKDTIADTKYTSNLVGTILVGNSTSKTFAKKVAALFNKKSDWRDYELGASGASDLIKDNINYKNGENGQPDLSSSMKTFAHIYSVVTPIFNSYTDVMKSYVYDLTKLRNHIVVRYNELTGEKTKTAHNQMPGRDFADSDAIR